MKIQLNESQFQDILTEMVKDVLLLEASDTNKARTQCKEFIANFFNYSYEDDRVDEIYNNFMNVYFHGNNRLTKVIVLSPLFCKLVIYYEELYNVVDNYHQHEINNTYILKRLKKIITFLSQEASLQKMKGLKYDRINDLKQIKLPDITKKDTETGERFGINIEYEKCFDYLEDKIGRIIDNPKRLQMIFGDNYKALETTNLFQDYKLIGPLTCECDDVIDYNYDDDYDYDEYVDFMTASEFGDATNSSQPICYTQDIETWKEWIEGNKLYILVAPNFDNSNEYPEEHTPSNSIYPGKTAYDKYGMSMLFIIVNENGGYEHCTTRWNHEATFKSGCDTDEALTQSDLKELMTEEQYNEVFNGSEDSINNMYTAFYNNEPLDEIFDVIGGNDIYKIIKYEKKYNIVEERIVDNQLERRFLWRGNDINEWFDRCKRLNNNLFLISYNDSYNFFNINEGKLIFQVPLLKWLSEIRSLEYNRFYIKDNDYKGSIIQFNDTCTEYKYLFPKDKYILRLIALDSDLDSPIYFNINRTNEKLRSSESNLLKVYRKVDKIELVLPDWYQQVTYDDKFIYVMSKVNDKYLSNVIINGDNNNKPILPDWYLQVEHMTNNFFSVTNNLDDYNIIQIGVNNNKPFLPDWYRNICFKRNNILQIGDSVRGYNIIQLGVNNNKPLLKDKYYDYYIYDFHPFNMKIENLNGQYNKIIEIDNKLHLMFPNWIDSYWNIGNNKYAVRIDYKQCNIYDNDLQQYVFPQNYNNMETEKSGFCYICDDNRKINIYSSEKNDFISDKWFDEVYDYDVTKNVFDVKIGNVSYYLTPDGRLFKNIKDVQPLNEIIDRLVQNYRRN